MTDDPLECPIKTHDIGKWKWYICFAICFWLRDIFIDFPITLHRVYNLYSSTLITAQTLLFALPSLPKYKVKSWNSLLIRCQVCIFSSFCLWGGFVHMWCQRFFKVRVVLCLHTGQVCSMGVSSQDTLPPSMAPKIPTPNPCVCLLTPLLNIYILIQTASEGERHRPALFCINMRLNISHLPPRERKSQNIHSNQSDETNSGIHRGHRSKQLLAQTDRSLISTGIEWEVTPRFTNILSLSLGPEPQTVMCRTCQALCCEQKQTDGFL